MKRRNFIRITGLGAVFAYSTCLLIAENESPPIFKKSGKTKVIVARGNDMKGTFDIALQELGGLQNFIDKRRCIAIKPDMGRDAFPEEGQTTNPLLIKHLSRQCYKLESGSVAVFDHCADDWTKCYKNSGIERAAKNSGVKVLPGNHEMYYRERQIHGASVLTHARIHNCVNPSNLMFDVPVLKKDQQTTISGGLKNLMGCVYDWNFYSKNGLDQCLAEFLFYKRPELTVIDAGHLLGTGAGTNSEYVLIASTDVLAADAVACRLMGIDPLKVGHLKIAAGLGFGIIAETEMEVKDISL